MGTPTYTPIASQTLTSSASSVTFSSIPADYRDLILIISMQTTGTQDLGLRFNSDSGSNYNYVYARGNGSTAASGSASSQSYFSPIFNDSNVGDSFIKIDILDYSATDKHKSILSRQDWALASTRMTAGRWASTSAINTILISSFGGTYDSGSTFSLYGVAA